MKTRPLIYLDYAATTPVDPAVFSAMKPYFSTDFGNPGSLYTFGQRAIAAVDKARETVAAAIGANFREVIFTGSATEANNLALRGTIKARQLQHPKETPRVLISSLEHESVLETAEDLKRSGAEVVFLSSDKNGSLNIGELKKSLNERTVLVSIMYANNEIGTVNSIGKIAEVIKAYRTSNNSQYPLLHTDAVQAFQFLDCNVQAIGVDLMTLSGHKIYGPKGVGVLYVRREQERRGLSKTIKNLKPIITGGGQEYGMRSGTENVPLIVGLAKAMELALKKRPAETVRLAKLRQQLLSGIKTISKKAQTNGQSEKSSATTTLPNILNVYLPGHSAEDLLTQLDLSGVAVSAGSACTARSTQVSHVLLGLGLSPERAKQSIRFSLGRQTTERDIASTLKVLRNILRP